MTEPLLLRIARLCVGVLEVPGPGDNPIIMKWAKDIKAPGFTGDSVPWCAVGMNRWCMAAGYPLSGTGWDLLRARSFEKWGVPLSEPALGAMLVFQRPEGGHVGLYIGERADSYRIIGANQGDAVSEIWILKSRLVPNGIRWPLTVPIPLTGPILLANDGRPVSTNEA
jgi:uncharacterized protein (TIGR02594 family)